MYYYSVSSTTAGRDRRCVFCKRIVPHDDYDLHYVMCLTRPRVTYNGEFSSFSCYLAFTNLAYLNQEWSVFDVETMFVPLTL